MARATLDNLRTRLRRMINDTVSPFLWSDDELDEILDQNRWDFFELRLMPQRNRRSYYIGHGNIEERHATDTTIFRLYDSSDVDVATTDYTVDYLNGVITFNADQEGEIYFFDGRSFDLNGAAAMGWEEYMGTKAVSAIRKFSEDGQSVEYANVEEQGVNMAKYYRAMKRRRPAEAIRA